MPAHKHSTKDWCSGAHTSGILLTTGMQVPYAVKHLLLTTCSDFTSFLLLLQCQSNDKQYKQRKHTENKKNLKYHLSVAVGLITLISFKVFCVSSSVWTETECLSLCSSSLVGSSWKSSSCACGESAVSGSSISLSTFTQDSKILVKHRN